MSDTTIKFDPEWCCWAASGWEDALEGSVRDARRVTRAAAQTFYAREAGEPWADIRVWKRYIRPLPRADLYVWWVENRSEGEWEAHDARGLGPHEVPDDWDESVLDFEDWCPRWEFVHCSHSEAIPVWVCGFRREPTPATGMTAMGCCFTGEPPRVSASRR